MPAVVAAGSPERRARVPDHVGPIEEDDLGARRGRSGISFQSLDEWLEEARLDLRVVVEEQDMLCSGGKCSAQPHVDAARESAVLVERDHMDVWESLAHCLARAVGRVVVHEDDEQRRIGCVRKGAQAVERVLATVPGQHDDPDPRCHASSRR